MTGLVELFAATVVGSNHRDVGANNQDAFGLGKTKHDGKDYYFGIVCDGMSRDKRKATREHGWHSEAGAQLACYFALRKIEKLITFSTPLSVIPDMLFEMLTSFITLQANIVGLVTQRDIASYIREHWLFTVLGFIKGPQETIVFTQGDGVVKVNSFAKYLDQGGQPLYLGYCAMPWDVPDYVTSNRSFETWNLATADIQFLAIASDGWKSHFSLLEEVSSVTLNSWELQLNMNVWSRDSGVFSDDATIAGFYQKG